jgi:tetratricopeptide (TPR) repeat protein
MAITFAVCAALAMLAAPARADDEKPTLGNAIALYDDMEYTRAAAMLEKVVRDRFLSEEARVQGYKYLGLSYLVIGRRAEAAQAFRELLRLRPKFRLPRTESARARDLLEEIRQTIVVPDKLGTMARSRLVLVASPPSPTAGTPVTITVAVSGKENPKHRVLVHHRRTGQKSFSVVQTSRTKTGQHKATIPGTFVAAPRIEYYATVQNEKGVVIATEGSKGVPLVLIVAKQKRAKKRGLVGRWWFWASVGTAVAAGAATVYYTKFRDTSQDAIVDIAIE